MSAHINTYIYIHTRIQNVHMNARKARLKRRRGSDCANSQLDTKKFYPSPCPHHDSAPSRPHLLICTGAELIHLVHCPRQFPALPWPPETRSFFCHFGGFLTMSPNLISLFHRDLLYVLGDVCFYSDVSRWVTCYVVASPL